MILFLILLLNLLTTSSSEDKPFIITRQFLETAPLKEVIKSLSSLESETDFLRVLDILKNDYKPLQPHMLTGSIFYAFKKDIYGNSHKCILFGTIHTADWIQFKEIQKNKLNFIDEKLKEVGSKGVIKLRIENIDTEGSNYFDEYVMQHVQTIQKQFRGMCRICAFENSKGCEKYLIPLLALEDQIKAKDNINAWNSKLISEDFLVKLYQLGDIRSFTILYQMSNWKLEILQNLEYHVGGTFYRYKYKEFIEERSKNFKYRINLCEKKDGMCEKKDDIIIIGLGHLTDGENIVELYEQNGYAIELIEGPIEMQHELRDNLRSSWEIELSNLKQIKRNRYFNKYFIISILFCFVYFLTFLLYKTEEHML